MWQWLFQLQGAQSTVVGSFAGFVFGVIALILGALFNFHLNRKRDAQLRFEEANAVAAALHGEIVLVRKELVRTAILVARIEEEVHSFDKSFSELIRLQDPILYRALANKLGLLDPTLVLAIADFYTNFELVRSWLPFIVNSEDRKFPFSAASVLRPAIKAIEGIKPTLDEMALKMGVKVQIDDADLACARHIVEREDNLVRSVSSQ